MINFQKTKGDDNLTTPFDLFSSLDREFHFTLDPCSSVDNHLCDTFFTIEDNGLLQDWSGHSVFCNPPYSRIRDWVIKCWEEGKKPNTLVCMLIPARTDTSWFHDYVLHQSEIRFIRGRLCFGNSSGNAPFPSMLVIYRGPRKSFDRIRIL